MPAARPAPAVAGGRGGFGVSRHQSPGGLIHGGSRFLCSRHTVLRPREKRPVLYKTLRLPYRTGCVRLARQMVVAGRLTDHQPFSSASRARKASSSSTFTPSSLALVSFEPAPGPATPAAVLAETDPASLAPSPSRRSLPCSRLMLSRVPVSTQVWPASGRPAVCCRSP